jgi:hypothetical protein
MGRVRETARRPAKIGTGRGAQPIGRSSKCGSVEYRRAVSWHGGGFREPRCGGRERRLGSRRNMPGGDPWGSAEVSRGAWRSWFEEGKGGIPLGIPVSIRPQA